MHFGTRSRLALTLALSAAALALPRGASAGCAVVEADRDANGTTDVRLTGDTKKQIATAEIRNDGSYLVQIDCNGNGLFTDVGDVVRSGAGPIESYILELAGNDTITVVQADNLVGASRSVVIALAGITNSVTFDTLGNDLLSGSNLAIEIIGSTRFDFVTLDFAGSVINSSELILRGDLSSDQDRLDYFAPATVTNSVVDINIDLGSGANKVNWTDAGTITGSTETVALSGSDVTTETDTVTTDFAGKIEGGSRLEFFLKLNSGDDRYLGRFDVASYDVDSLGGSSSEARYYFHGGPGFDRLDVSSIGSGAATDNGLIEIRMEGYHQPDTLTLDWDGLTGSGVFRLRSFTGDASDLVLASLATASGSSNDLDVAICSDSEADISLQGDTAYLAVVDRGSATAGPAGAVIVDGGLDGIDFCAFFGTVPHLALNCEAGSY